MNRRSLLSAWSVPVVVAAALRRLMESRYVCDMCEHRGVWRVFVLSSLRDGYAHERRSHPGVFRD